MHRLFCAVVSMLFVPPTGPIWGYLDIRVLACCFVWTLVVAGLEETDFSRSWPNVCWLVGNASCILSLALVLLPFFSSMLITNDVAFAYICPVCYPGCWS